MWRSRAPFFLPCLPIPFSPELFLVYIFLNNIVYFMRDSSFIRLKAGSFGMTNIFLKWEDESAGHARTIIPYPRQRPVIPSVSEESPFGLFINTF